MPAVLLVLVLLLAVARPVSAAPTDWAWPVDGPPRTSRPFAPGPSTYAAGHRGADLPGTPGGQVRAAGAGLVSYAGLLAGRGVVVVVHGELRTTYEPVSAQVRVGQQVSRGELLGALAAGHPGCRVEACLHWGLRRGETYLDPVRLVLGGPVRLLPLRGPLPDGRDPVAPAPVLLPAGAASTLSGMNAADAAVDDASERGVDAPDAVGPRGPGVSAAPGPGAVDARGPGAAPGQAAGRERRSGAGAGVPLGAGLAGAALLLGRRRRRT